MEDEEEDDIDFNEIMSMSEKEEHEPLNEYTTKKYKVNIEQKDIEDDDHHISN
jgi:hypothetical protein